MQRQDGRTALYRVFAQPVSPDEWQNYDVSRSISRLVVAV